MSPDTKLKPSGNVCNALQTNAVISCKRLQPVQCFTTVSTFYTVIEHILKKKIIIIKSYRVLLGCDKITS